MKVLDFYGCLDSLQHDFDKDKHFLPDTKITFFQNRISALYNAVSELDETEPKHIRELNKIRKDLW